MSSLISSHKATQQSHLYGMLAVSLFILTSQSSLDHHYPKRKYTAQSPQLLPTKISAVIITLNTARESDSPFAAQVSPPRFLADSCANACDVLEKSGIRRIVFMSTAGVGDSWARLPLLSKAFLGWTNVKYALQDHELVDKEIRSTNMDWTLVRPVRLEFDDPKQKASGIAVKEVQTLGSDGQGMRMSDSANVDNVARFLVRVAVEGLFVKSAVVVRN